MLTHLLVVDDDVDIVELLRRYFSTNGFHVSSASNGAQMRKILRAEPVDFVILDLGLPDEDGLVLAAWLRENWSGPFIMLTGRSDTVDRIVGLELGADDYVTKPFDLRELLARVRSVMRRSDRQVAQGAQSTRLVFEDFTLDLTSRTLTRGSGVDVPLTTSEFNLLQAFAEHPNQVLSRSQLMMHTRGNDVGAFDRSVDVQVGRLRRKILAHGQPDIIRAVRGVGYLFVPKVTAS